MADALVASPGLPMSRTPSVLVVDSHPDAAESTALVLLLHGIPARVTHGRTEALEAVRGWTPDVVVLDIPLRDGDGYHLMGELRVVLRHLPLTIVVTALPGCEAESRLAGCDHHFLKPLDPRALVDLIERYADTAPAVVG
jgi:CheY-like chemotaxis protein